MHFESRSIELALLLPYQVLTTITPPLLFLFNYKLYQNFRALLLISMLFLPSKSVHCGQRYRLFYQLSST